MVGKIPTLMRRPHAASVSYVPNACIRDRPAAIAPSGGPIDAKCGRAGRQNAAEGVRRSPGWNFCGRAANRPVARPTARDPGRAARKSTLHAPTACRTGRLCAGRWCSGSGRARSSKSAWGEAAARTLVSLDVATYPCLHPQDDLVCKTCPCCPPDLCLTFVSP